MLRLSTAPRRINGFSVKSLLESSRLKDASPVWLKSPGVHVGGAAWSTTVVNSDSVPSRLSTISIICCCCGKSMHDAVVISQNPPSRSGFLCAWIVLTWVCPLIQAIAFGYR